MCDMLLSAIILTFSLLFNGGVATTFCEAPSEIKNFKDLECSIVTDSFNIQSLTEAFFPTNRYPAVVVEVHYYENRTNHPLNSSTDAFGADYIYRWVSTPALLFGDPKVLEGLSLRTLVIHYQYAHIRIAQFSEEYDDNKKKGLLSNVTIWLKSYAINRASTQEFGLDISQRGYSQYKSDDSSHPDDFYVFGREKEYKLYIMFTTASLVSLVFFCILLVPVKIDKYYVNIHEKATSAKKSIQRYHFKSIVWAIICVFGYVLSFILGVSAYHTLTFGFNWKSEYQFFYPLIIAAVVLIAVVALIISYTIVRRKKDSLIPIPYFIYFVLCQFDPVQEPQPKSFQYVVLFIWQIIGVWIILATSVALTFFACGMILAVFANPVEVIATLGIYICIVLLAIFAFAFLFERVEEIFGEASRAHGMSSKVRFSFQIFVFIAAVIFIGLFGYTYITVILFVGNTNDLGLVTGFGKVIPILLVAGISWVMKNELQKYNTDTDPMLLHEHDRSQFSLQARNDEFVKRKEAEELQEVYIP